MAERKQEAKTRRAAIREQHKHEGVPILLFAHGCFTSFNTTLFEIGMGTESDNANYDAPANWLHSRLLLALWDPRKPPKSIAPANQKLAPHVEPVFEARLRLCWPKSWLKHLFQWDCV